MLFNCDHMTKAMQTRAQYSVRGWGEAWVPGPALKNMIQLCLMYLVLAKNVCLEFNSFRWEIQLM